MLIKKIVILIIVVSMTKFIPLNPWAFILYYWYSFHRLLRNGGQSLVKYKY